MASWSRKHLSGFIELYRSHECLWKIRSKAYKNRNLKDKAYGSLVQFVRQFDEDVNRNFIVRKINGLRSSFRKEYHKVEYSLSKGHTGVDLYRPRLWYFNDLLFLKDQEIPSQTDLETEETETPSIDFFGDGIKQEPEVDRVSVSDPGSPQSAASHSWSNSAPVSSMSHPSSQDATLRTVLPNPVAAPFKRKAPDEGIHTPSNSVFEVHHSSQPQKQHNNYNSYSADEEDRSSVFGKHVAFKLRAMSREQRIHAEKIISDTLYEGELGNLSRNSCLVTTARI